MEKPIIYSTKPGLDNLDVAKQSLNNRYNPGMDSVSFTLNKKNI